MLALASDEHKKDKEVVLAAVKQSRWVLKYADETLQEDPDILKVINADY